MGELSRFPTPGIEALPEDLRARVAELEEKMGFVPNLFRVMSCRPDELRLFMAYHDALMDREGGLTKAEREMIVVATSACNQCLYCGVSHGAFLRIRSKDPRLSEQVALNYREADLSERQRAMLDYAVRLATRPWTVTQSHLDALGEHGFDHDDLWDIGAITALFAMSNRLASHTGMPPNDEFYGMAR
jgi:uncharacterized peroxidase-related enzyme